MKEIYLDGLNNDMIYIIEVVGMNNFLTLCNYFQGESIYFPKMTTVYNHNRNEKIKKEFNGYNIKNLSSKYNISERQLKRIVNK